ncbi:MAG TPA: sugar MFS transporter [Chitinophagaceae bacterium]|nr:sugar MFS transporter [Chitinophagaceae bacterium]
MKRSNKPIVIIGILFFVFGFVTWLGAILIPYLRIACRIGIVAGYLVAFSFYISYAVMAIPAAAVLRLTGYKKGMSFGLLIMAVGAGLFIPAAYMRSYPLFLTGLFVQGTGLAILQTAANPYVTILGPQQSAARRISIMGICSGTASVVGPLILGAVILQDADGVEARIATMNATETITTLNNLAHRVILPYSIIAFVLVLLAMLVLFSSLPELDADAENETTAIANTNKTSIFQFPHLLLGAFTLFLYVGVEVMAGDTIINYGTSQGISLSVARFFASCTQVCMLAGYVIGIIAIPKYMSQQQALKISPLIGLLFVFAALFSNGLASVIFIALLGLSNSLVWPSIWPLAINGLGRFTKIGSSFLIIAIGGGAILPLVYGWLAHTYTPQHAYWLVVPCYLCIWYYGKAGHKIGLSLKAQQ